MPISTILLMMKLTNFYNTKHPFSMKKHLITLLLFSISFQVFSQKGEKIESLKIGYLTNKLNLDAKTAEKFWPIYHQYENEMMDVVQEKRRMNQNDLRNADEILDQEQKALDIKRGQVVADIGAGPGYLTAKLSECVGESGIVYAVDIQQEMIDYARKNLLEKMNNNNLK